MNAIKAPKGSCEWDKVQQTDSLCKQFEATEHFVAPNVSAYERPSTFSIAYWRKPFEHFKFTYEYDFQRTQTHEVPNEKLPDIGNRSKYFFKNCQIVNKIYNCFEIVHGRLFKNHFQENVSCT